MRRPRARATKKLNAWRAKWLIRLKRATLVSAVVGVVLCARLFAFPATDKVVTADAAVVFSSGGDPALQEALTLVNAGKVSALVMFGGSGGLCAGRGSVEVLCPAAGAGTVEQVKVLTQLAASRHWDTVVLVTPRHLLSRSALLVGRCSELDALRRAAPTPSGGDLFGAALGEAPRYLAELTADTNC